MIQGPLLAKPGERSVKSRSNSQLGTTLARALEISNPEDGNAPISTQVPWLSEGCESHWGWGWTDGQPDTTRDAGRAGSDSQLCLWIQAWAVFTYGNFELLVFLN